MDAADVINAHVPDSFVLYHLWTPYMDSPLTGHNIDKHTEDSSFANSHIDISFDFGLY